MRTLTQLQQNRRIIQDFTLTTLAGIPGEFGKLTYMASLRDLSSGKYEHAGLAALYPDEAMQQALEVFFEVREIPGLKKKPSTSELIDWLKLLLADDSPEEVLKNRDSSKAIPPLYGAFRRAIEGSRVSPSGTSRLA